MNEAENPESGPTPKTHPAAPPNLQSLPPDAAVFADLVMPPSGETPATTAADGIPTLDFDQLMKEFDTAPDDATARLILGLAPNSSKRITLSEFRGFPEHLFSPAEGVFEFAVSSSQLKSAAELISLTIRESSWARILVKITITQSWRNLRTFDGGSFIDYSIPAEIPADNIAADQAISLVVSHNDLRIALQAVDEKVHLTYDAQAQSLHMRSGSFERPLQISPLKSFKDVDANRLGTIDPDQRITIQTNALLEAVRYITPFITEPGGGAQIQNLQIHNGCLIAEGPEFLIAVESSSLGGLSLHVRRKDVAVLQTVLGLFSDEVALFRTETYCILTDGTVFFGFDRLSYSAKPEVNKLLQWQPVQPHRLRFERNALCRVLAGMVQHPDRSRAQMQVSPRVKKGISCSFSTRSNKTGHRVRGRVTNAVALSILEGTFLTWVPVEMLAAVVGAHESTCVDFLIDLDKRFLSIDEAGEQTSARFFLSIGLPSKRPVHAPSPSLSVEVAP